MRTFIAIPLPRAVQEELSRLQVLLGKSDADIKWVEPVNMHITLRFLGEIGLDDIALLSRQIKSQVKCLDSFDIAVEKTGAFPNPSHPKTIWAGLREKDTAFCECLYSRVNLCLERSDLDQAEKKFFPHITIGRVRSQKNRQALKNLLEQEKNFRITTKINVSKITLFSSLLTQDGPVYSIQEEFHLTANI